MNKIYNFEVRAVSELKRKCIDYKGYHKYSKIIPKDWRDIEAW